VVQLFSKSFKLAQNSFLDNHQTFVRPSDDYPILYEKTTSNVAITRELSGVELEPWLVDTESNDCSICDKAMKLGNSVLNALRVIPPFTIFSQLTGGTLESTAI
jgi:hypothetical protein